MTTADPRERRLAYIAWVLVCLIWGTTYLGIRVTLETMPPLLMSGLRWTVAGALLAGYLVLRGERLPDRSGWASAVLLGFLLLGIGNGAVAWAEQWVPSGLTAVIVASSPFWMAGIESLRSDGEQLTRRLVIGFAIGFSGIVLLVWPDLTLDGAHGRGFIAGFLALQFACLGWSIGSSYSRRHARDTNVLSATAAQMIAGGVMMLIAATIHGEWRLLHFAPRSTVALAYLTTVGAIGGFASYTYALRHLPVSFVSLYAYINPIIAVTLGVLLLGEPFNARMTVAAALVLLGVAIVKGRSRVANEKREPVAEERPVSLRRAQPPIKRAV
jgi:drug/metabolite transporter (DMT)-like permease